MNELHEVYEKLTYQEEFDGSHISLDRDAQGNEFLAVAPDWIDMSGLAFALDVAQNFELALSLTSNGLRFEAHTSSVVAGVEDVKRTIRGEGGDG